MIQRRADLCILLLVALHALRGCRTARFLVAVDTCARRRGGVVEGRLLSSFHPSLSWLGMAGSTSLLGCAAWF